MQRIILKPHIFLLCVIINSSTVAMRCIRRPVTRGRQTVRHATMQQNAPRVQRAYAVDSGKYTKVLIGSQIIRSHYFTRRRREDDYGDDFRIPTEVLQHIMVDAKTNNKFPIKSLITSATNIFGTLHEVVKNQSHNNYSILRDFDSKTSLFLLLRHIRWDGTMKELEIYPERREFPILLNEKEVKLTFEDKVHSKSDWINGLSINCHGVPSQDQAHDKEIIETYERLFMQKGTC